MPRINLLPWRDERAQRAQAAVPRRARWRARWSRVLLAFLGYLMFGSMIDGQQRRNERLRAEIKSLDKQIEEINRPRERQAEIHRAHGDHREAAALASGDRARVRRDREDAARWRVPDRRQADRPASSSSKASRSPSTRVSAFMRNIDSSEWLKNPELEVVETAQGHGPARASRCSPMRSPNGRRRRPRPRAGAGARPPRSAAARGVAPMNLIEELRSLDPRDPGRWPLPVRIGAVAIWLRGADASCSATSSCGERESPELQRRRTRSRSCARSSAPSMRKAVNLDVYKQQLEGHRALLRRAAAPAARQDRGAEPAGGHLADGPRGRTCRRSCSSPSAEAEEGFLRRAADQDPPHRQLSPVRPVRQRHRGAAAHRHAARHRDQTGRQGRATTI